MDDGTPAAGRQVRVIIAEDEALIALTIQDILEDHGYAVCGIATTAQAVVDGAERHRPDIALVDVNLAGGSNGLDAIRPLTSIGVPAVVVSGHATPGDAAAVGARGMLRKPFGDRDLLALIDYVLGRGPVHGKPPHGLLPTG